MPLTTRTIRLFVSSTFSDLKAERNALQAEVFPRLHRHCLERGWSFQAIDLRWGVSTEAALDQSTMRICLAEIARCQAVTPRPNFLVLLGDRYGWRPLPAAVPAAELEALLLHLPAATRDQLLWRDDQPDDAKGWYRLDENAVVPLPDGSGPDKGVYLLLPRNERFVDDDTWSREVERPLGAALRQAARTEWPGATDSRRLTYEASATEQEVVAGALSVPNAGEHVRAFFRRIDVADGVALRDALKTGRDLRQYRDFVDLLDGDHPDTDAIARLQALKERLGEHLGRDDREHAARWEEGGFSTEHIQQFVADVYESLQRLIDAQIKQHANEKPVDEEPLRHWAFAERRARDFTGRESDLALINAYLRSAEPVPPLIVYGDSGSGKSALLAQAALQLRAPGFTSNDDGRAAGQLAVIARFVGATPAAGDARSLLEGLCRELGSLYGANNDKLTLDVNRLAVEFRQRLDLATAERPLVLFIDALDQLPADTASVLNWLPPQPGPHVRIVVSTLPGALLDMLVRELPDAPKRALQPMTRDNGLALLDRWLYGVNRRLTQSQTDRVIASFTDTGSPLYLRLAFEAARLWPSHDAARPLSNNVVGALNALFDRLSADSSHGPLLVNRVLGYLSCARQGLSEPELLQLLARDEAYWGHFLAHARHELPSGEGGQPVSQVPVVIWSRLFQDLEPYLSWRNAHGASLMSFFHPTTFVPVVQSRFEQSDGDRRQRHESMASYFLGAARGEAPAKPWTSDDVRGFAECVYHLVNAGDVEGCSQVLTDLAFVAGKVRHGLVFELIDDYRLGIRALPEAQPELEEERQRQARLDRWSKEITEYSRQWSRRRDIEAQTGAAVDEPEPRLPEPPPTSRMWGGDEIAAECQRLLDQPTRIDSIRAFEGFVRAQCYPLLEHGWREGFVGQHSLAQYPSGPVCMGAQALLADCRAPVFLRRWPPGSVTNPKPALLATLEGHNGAVYSASVTLDGRRAVSGSLDSTLRVWDLGSGACLRSARLRTVEGHNYPVASMSITSDGQRAVLNCYANRHNTLQVWDLDSGACLRTLEGHSGQVSSVSVTPDGRRAVSGSWDRTLRVWDLDRGACLRTLEGHSGQVMSVSITADGRRAVSGGDHVRVWDLDSGTCLRTLEGHRWSVLCVSITADGRRAVSGGDQTVRVWDLDSGTCLRSFEGHSASVQSVSITPDGRRAVSGSYDRSLRVWDLDRGTCLRTLEGHSGQVRSVSVTPDGLWAVSGSGDRDWTLRVWDLAHGDCRRTNIEGRTSQRWKLSVAADGRRAVSGGMDNTLRFWDLGSGACLRTLEGHSSSVHCLRITADEQRAVSGSSDSTLRVWDLDRGTCLRILEGHSSSVDCLSITADGQRAVSGSSDSTLRVWDLDSGICLRTLEGHSGQVSSVSVTPDGWRAVSVGDDALRVWDLDSGTCLRSIGGYRWSVLCVSITADGRRAVSGGDQTVRVWDLDSGTCLRSLEGHSTSVRSVSITPDGRRAVSASDDHTLRLWDLNSGACLRTLEGHRRPVEEVIVTSDGRRAVSSDGQTVRAWGLDCGRCLDVLVADGEIYSVALGGRNTRTCVDTNVGAVLLLELHGIESGPMILTTTSTGNTRCTACGEGFRARDTVIAAIRELSAHLAPDQSPCLDLPDSAFTDPRLLAHCLHCNAPVKFNPFFADMAPT